MYTYVNLHTHTDSASQLSSNNTVLELDVCSIEQSLQQPPTMSSVEEQPAGKFLLIFGK